MTIYLENEIEANFSFDIQQLAEQVAEQVLDREDCPYETQINILITDGEGIRQFNAQYRNIDRETDVLSFPNVEYDEPANFENLEHNETECFDPDSGELVLGDIILCADRIREQAETYGHSEKREFAFLVAHSVLHLCGYDHMAEEDAAIMEEKQEGALAALGITRD